MDFQVHAFAIEVKLRLVQKQVGHGGFALSIESDALLHVRNLLIESCGHDPLVGTSFLEFILFDQGSSWSDERKEACDYEDLIELFSTYDSVTVGNGSLTPLLLGHLGSDVD